MKHPFKEFFSGLIAQGIGTLQGSPGTYVTMPLSELIDALALFEALKSEQEHWVEVCLDFAAYDSLALTFFTQGEEIKEEVDEGAPLTVALTFEEREGSGE